jgi:hypothetical protein
VSADGADGTDDVIALRAWGANLSADAFDEGFVFLHRLPIQRMEAFGDPWME